MQKNISAHGRRMVTIVDPHIFRDNEFPLHKEAEKNGYYIKVLVITVIITVYVTSSV
jgi:alpha 1,3-glucosidase